MSNYDFIVIGGGIAGASVGYELASHGHVLILERERVAGHHSTGRSAAVLTENYGNSVIRRLTLATRPFLEKPPTGFTENPLVSRRKMMWIAREDQREELAGTLSESQRLVPSIYSVNALQARNLCPVLRTEYVSFGIVEPNALDLDVHAIHQAFLRGLRRKGGKIEVKSDVSAMSLDRSIWTVQTATKEYRAPVVVNAAGAWCDVIGNIAGARPVGLVPKRRTAFIFEGPSSLEGESLDAWPVVIDAHEDFYFKPESGKLLGSPADETPMDPCDATVDDLDIAVAAERLQNATCMTITTIKRKWAGLRSFVPDKTPVCGFDKERPGFFWLAGQGGYGIQTSAALARAASDLIVNRTLPLDLLEVGLTPSNFSPERVQALFGRSQ